MKKLLGMLLTLVLLASVACGCAKKDSDDELKPNSVSDFEYTTTEKDETKIQITKYVGTDVNVVIPETIDGKEVTQIGRKAFYQSDIQTLVMPNTVKNIYSNAFWLCSKLENVQFSSNLTSVAFAAFADCVSLTSADLSADTMKIIDERAFHGCLSLKEVNFGDNITMIRDEAFRNCTSLQEVILPKNLAEIGEYAFGDCTSVKKIWIPKNVGKMVLVSLYRQYRRYRNRV